MKFLLTALSMIFGVSVAQAQTNFKYYGMTTANSPSTKVTEALIEKLKGTYTIDWKQNAGCAIKTQVEKDTDPIFVEFAPGQYWMSLYDGNKNCVFDIEKIRYLAIIENSYSICVRADSTIGSMKDVMSLPNVGIAYATGTPAKPMIESINKNYNTSIKPVLVTNSNAALTALLSKDVDVAYMISTVTIPQVAQNTIKCIATTESGKDNSLDKQLTKVNPAITTFNTQYVIGLKNVDDKRFKEISAEMNKVLASIQLPSNAIVTSLANSSEKDLTAKVNKITKDLYEATK